MYEALAAVVSAHAALNAVQEVRSDEFHEAHTQRWKESRTLFTRASACEKSAFQFTGLSRDTPVGQWMGDWLHSQWLYTTLLTTDEVRRRMDFAVSGGFVELLNVFARVHTGELPEEYAREVLG